MFRWYRESDACIIYLSDVPEPTAPNDVHVEDSAWCTMFKSSRWLTRGWCLQELLAPSRRRFYSKDWQPITDTAAVMKLIATTTRIPAQALAKFEPSAWSAAQKMSWAAKRLTTRLEDRSYSLMGLFGLTMPILYGEGDRAFIRLQTEIIQRHEDTTIFCWTSGNRATAAFTKWRGLLARSPDEFEHSGDIVVVNSRLRMNPIQLFNQGFRLDLRLRKRFDHENPALEFFALLKCIRKSSQQLCGIWVRRVFADQYIRVDSYEVPFVPSIAQVDNMSSRMFIKPTVTDIRWGPLDECARIAGFRSPEFFSQVSKDSWAVVPGSITTEKGRLWSFEFEDLPTQTESRIIEFAVTLLECKMTMAVKFNTDRAYGLTDTRTMEHDPKGTNASRWHESTCCDWRLVESEACSRAMLSATSWVEVSQNDEPWIHLEFLDEGNHEQCAQDREASKRQSIRNDWQMVGEEQLATKTRIEEERAASAKAAHFRQPSPAPRPVVEKPLMEQPSVPITMASGVLSAVSRLQDTVGKSLQAFVSASPATTTTPGREVLTGELENRPKLNAKLAKPKKNEQVSPRISHPANHDVKVSPEPKQRHAVQPSSAERSGNPSTWSDKRAPTVPAIQHASAIKMMAAKQELESDASGQPRYGLSWTWRDYSVSRDYPGHFGGYGI